MMEHKLPCAAKNCKSKMILIDNNDNLLSYSCLNKPHEHNFRYNMTEKKWEQLIIKTKLVLNYNYNPCKTNFTAISKPEPKIEKIQVSTIHESATESKLTEIKGIGSKRAEELQLAGVKTISDLAKRSPKHLSSKTGIPITQISKWITEANKLT
jgi:hypothetical protein